MALKGLYYAQRHRIWLMHTKQKYVQKQHKARAGLHSADLKRHGSPNKTKFTTGKLDSSGKTPMEEVRHFLEPTTQLLPLAMTLPCLLGPRWYLGPTKWHSQQHSQTSELRARNKIKRKTKRGNNVPFTKWKAITELLKIGSKQREGGKYWQNSIFPTNAVARVQFATKSTVLSPSLLQSDTLFGLSIHDALAEKCRQAKKTE